MKIFLTGGTGVVGTRALPALAAGGHDVTAVARTAEKAELVRRLGGEPIEVDLFDPAAVQAAVVGHEVVVHLATSIPDLSKSNGKDAWTLNDRLRREASAHLVDAALATGAARYVQESICYPYADGGADWIDEDSPVDADPPAFAGAVVAEAQAARFTEGGGIGVVLRFGQFYAPEASHTRSFNRTLRWRVNPFVGPRGAYASFIHGDDAGSAVAAALRAPAGTYNVTDDEPVTRAEAGRIAAAALGRGRPLSVPVALSPASAKPLMRSLRVSNARFRSTTGWEPSHPSIRGAWPAATS